MEYRVRVWTAAQGDVVPLVYVAQAMARHAATAYGTLPLHGPTLVGLRPEYELLLLNAATTGQLTVCDCHGRVASVTELVETAEASAAEFAGAASVTATSAESVLPSLRTKRQHLTEWGKSNGDVFVFVDTPGTVVNADLRSFTDAGFGKVIEPGYHRGFLGGGESEPWRDGLNEEPVETIEKRRDRYLDLFESEEKNGKLGALQRVADMIGVDRSNLSKDLKKARIARAEALRAGNYVAHLVQDGKRAK